MTTLNLDTIIRPNIRKMKPYSSARSEFSATASVMLDANENSLADGPQRFNRYPDPLQLELKERLSILKGVPASRIFLGNGSDEAIDLLLRATCVPGNDAVLVCPPTYGMYEVAAGIQDAIVVEVPLLENFQLDVPAILEAITGNMRLLFLCSPNNPTGNLLRREDVLLLLRAFNGLLVLDEAYIDFSAGNSMIPLLQEFPNLVILQTLSKAWGLAGVRLGLAFAAPQIIDVLNRIKPPYNISMPAQAAALCALNNTDAVSAWIDELNQNRFLLIESLKSLQIVEAVFPSDANFLLVRFTESEFVCKHLLRSGIVVRNRSQMPLCDGCLRITVGTRAENIKLIETLKLIEL